MNKLYSTWGIVLISILAIAGYSHLLISFVVNDTISSFASDSANYIVMARYLSPWQTPSAPVLTAWAEQDFPLFFPFVLAIFGAAYSYFIAHFLVAMFLICSLPLIYVFSRQVKLDQLSSFIIVILFALSPATWVNSLGILSENLYILLSVLTLYCYQKLDINNKIQLALFGLLLALVILTRTIGIALLVSYLMISCFKYAGNRTSGIKLFMPAIIAVVIILSVSLLQDKVLPEQYLDQMFGLLDEEVEQTALKFDFIQQVKALSDAWLVSWMYYWNENTLLATWFFSALGLLGTIGLLYRAKLLEYDALYLVIYLLILVFWPHPGQATRFIYPVLFLLLLNAFFIMRILLQNHSSKIQNYSAGLVLILSLFSIFPAQLYTYQRFELGKELGYAHYKEFYIFPDLNEAKQRSELQDVIYNDLVFIKNITDQDERIIYFVTAYVALLSDRVGVKLDFYKDDAGKVRLKEGISADYVYLSRLHPRMTRDNINGLNLLPYFTDWASVVRTTYSGSTSDPLSVLLKAD